MLRKSRFLLTAGLFVTAGLFANGHPVLAQTRECPSVEDPSVTAQQVAEGTGSLKDFTLAAKALAERHTAAFGCVIREDQSPWRSGSTYVVRLTREGRVGIHAKDMGLSARQLDPDIYQAILEALDIDGSDEVAEAASRDGGLFAVPGTSSKAYATAYITPLTVPYILIAGFDLDESHLIPFSNEGIDHANPSTTAKGVVDRDSLKEFVTAAGNYFLDQRTSIEALSKTRLAMRDPNGPWRHGSVYIYVWDPNSRLILVHAGNPDLYELQPLGSGVARDDNTGEKVLLLLEKALNKARADGKEKEGAFVKYSFDDPSDDLDNVPVPKIGYVREFEFTLQSKRISFVVGSGFYPRSSQVSQSTVVEAVLPQIMRSVTASTVDAVSSRIERATTATAPATAFSLGGATTLSDALQANGQSLVDGGIDLDRLLANSSFTLPLNMADNGGSDGEGSPFGSFTFWGNGDYRSISGGSPQSVDYDGSVTSANLGIDTRLSADLLAGVALSWSRGTVDYKASGASGDLTTRLLSVNPYVGWQMPGGMNLWSTAGYGFGKVEIDDKAAAAQESDMTQRMFAAGLKGTLVSSNRLIPGGATNLNVKGEVAFTWADVEGAGSIEEMALSVGRQRLMLEGAHVRKLASGATFTSSLELGMRNDTGDGETGTGAELGGALRYENTASRLTVEGRVRSLLSHSGDTAETGVSGLVRIAPNASGHGLALALAPSWGRTASSAQQLWESGIGTGTTGGNQARLNTEVGYGFDAPQGLGGVVTPYAGLGLGGNGSQSWRLGTRWQMADNRSVSLEGTRHEAASDDGPEHGLMLCGALRW